MQVSMALPPPQLWQDFERLTLDIAKSVFNDSGATAYGNQGAPQKGVDVYCREQSIGRLIGIQCKRYKTGKLSPGDLQNEVNNAKAFTPRLDQFIFATTETRRTKLQDAQRQIDAAQIKAGSFNVHIWFWDDYLSFLHKYSSPLKWYYDNILKLQGVYNLDHQILYLLHMAFSRPAFTTPLDQEEGGTGLFDAIRDTETALNTGQLKDRETSGVLRAAPGGIFLLDNSQWLTSLKGVLALVQDVRKQYKQAKANGEIVELSNRIQVYDLAAALEINRLRGDAVKLLNTVLVQAGLPEVISTL